MSFKHFPYINTVSFWAFCKVFTRVIKLKLSFGKPSIWQGKPWVHLTEGRKVEFDSGINQKGSGLCRFQPWLPDQKESRTASEDDFICKETKSKAGKEEKKPFPNGLWQNAALERERAILTNVRRPTNIVLVSQINYVRNLRPNRIYCNHKHVQYYSRNKNFT